jgi:FkbM family methyltransferase
LYSILENEESKELLLKLIAYRILGYKKVKLPVNTPDYWEKLKGLDHLIEGNDQINIDLGFLNLRLQKFNLQKIGYPISIFFNPLAIHIDFVLEQYCYTDKKNNKKVEVQKGDIVIDAGGCYGDTALYFAHKAGEHGKVYSFEFIPDNITIFKKNCELNPALNKRITLIENPLWSESEIPVYYLSKGPGSKVSFDKIPDFSGQSKTKTIDDAVKDEKIEKVDFIKMDIEGAELNALKGAVDTIKKHKPKLAICVYHSMEDFGTIPKFINELNLGYKFYLGHYTIYQEETVLFAIAE